MAEANIPTITRPGASSISFSRLTWMLDSEMECPGSSAPVLSVIKSKSPSLPIFLSLSISAGLSIIGLRSNLKSDVAIMDPAGVLISRAISSGML